MQLRERQSLVADLRAVNATFGPLADLAKAGAAEIERLEAGLLADIQWHQREAKELRDAADACDHEDREETWLDNTMAAEHETAADRLRAILYPAGGQHRA